MDRTAIEVKRPNNVTCSPAPAGSFLNINIPYPSISRKVKDIMEFNKKKSPK